MMAFVKADLKREKEELNKLIAESEEARKAHEEFQARIALQQKCFADNGFWSSGQRSNSTRYLAGGVAVGALPDFPALTRFQMARWASLVGAGAHP